MVNIYYRVKVDEELDSIKVECASYRSVITELRASLQKQKNGDNNNTCTCTLLIIIIHVQYMYTTDNNNNTCSIHSFRYVAVKPHPQYNQNSSE